MCTFMTSLPKNSKSAGVNKKPKNIVLTMRPCADENTYYRFRLLAFNSSGKNDRDDPHIVRFVHQIWGTHPEKGYPVLEDEIVCPVSPHVHVEGNKYGACKICDVAGKYWAAYSDSGFKDKDAGKKNKMFGRKYQAIVPVYVINDPNYDGNNNKFRVIIFNDKKQYTEFRQKIEKASIANHVFNGTNAVDCCIHMAEIPTVVNEGKPTEYVFKKREIDKIKFTTKPYDIPSITKETVDAMGFDETFYVTSTPDDINAFYKKHCTVSNDDIPDDDEEVNVFSAPSKPAAPIAKNNDVQPMKTVNTSKQAIPSIDDDLVSDDLATDPDDIGLDIPSSNSNDNTISNDDAQALIDELDI